MKNSKSNELHKPNHSFNPTSVQEYQPLNTGAVALVTTDLTSGYGLSTGKKLANLFGIHGWNHMTF